MILQLSSDQDLFRETTARFLAELVPPDELRRLRDSADGYDAGYWQRGAELGWVSLLVDERYGGGSISDHGLVDLSIVAHEFGAHAAPGPLIPTNVVAALLSAADSHPEVIEALMTGAATAAWCVEEPGTPTWDAVTLDVAVDGDDVVLNGVKRPVEASPTADWLLVTGRTGDGTTNVLVPSDAAGVVVRPLDGVDLTRRFGAVELSDVRLPRSAVVGEVGGGDQAVHRGGLIAVALGVSEMVGAMEAAFDMTVEWAFDRYSFGRPLASYQALKHRFADMKSWLEASHAIADDAVAAVATGSPKAAALCSAAVSYIGQQGPELAQDCIQIHGGIGLTFEHDLHFFLRRIVADRAVYGTPSDHRRRLADLAEQEFAPA